MYRIAGCGLAALVLVAGCRSAEVQSETGPSTAPAVLPATAAQLPVGMPITGRLDQTLSTNGSRVGDQFTVTVTKPVVAQNGQTAVPAGATVHGTISALDGSTHAGDVAYIRLRFDQITLNGQSHPFGASVVRTDVESSRSFNRRNPVRGAIAGAVLGAVLDRDLDSTITGAAVGTAVGTAISLGTGTVDASLPAGTTIELRSTQHVNVRSSS